MWFPLFCFFVGFTGTRELGARKRIGTTHYSTFENAVGALSGGETITLLTDVTLNKGIRINENVTLDLGGHTLKGYQTGYVLDLNSTVEIKNGTIELNGAQGGNLAIWLNRSASLTVDEDATVRSTGSVLNSKNGETTCRTIGFYGKGEDGCKDASLILNGTIEGEDGITINGGTIKEYTALYASDPQDGDPSNVTIEIKGGNFNGTEAVKRTDDKIAMTITGGYVTTNPTAYVAEGYVAVPSDKSGYTYMIDTAGFTVCDKKS